MKQFSTKFRARDAQTGEMKTWRGEYVEAPTWDMAQQWCYKNRGHLIVDGEIASTERVYENDFSKMIDFEIIGQN